MSRVTKRKALGANATFDFIVSRTQLRQASFLTSLYQLLKLYSAELFQKALLFA
jgi:hypothetical protein